MTAAIHARTGNRLVPYCEDGVIVGHATAAIIYDDCDGDTTVKTFYRDVNGFSMGSSLPAGWGPCNDCCPTWVRTPVCFTRNGATRQVWIQHEIRADGTIISTTFTDLFGVPVYPTPTDAELHECHPAPQLLSTFTYSQVTGRLRHENTRGNVASIDLCQVLNACPTVTPDQLPVARADTASRVAGTAASISLSANDDPGTAPSVWSYVSGNLPPGMTINANGSLTGTPTTAGAYTFRYRITDADGDTSEANATITITAAPTAAPVANDDTIANEFRVGINHSYYVGNNDSWQASQTPVTFSFASGTLPAGLTLSSSGNLSGTPTQAGTFTFTYRLTDKNGAFDTATITVTVAAANTGGQATELRFYYGSPGTFYTPIAQADVKLHPNSAYLASQLAANNAGYSGDRGVTTESYARTIVDWDDAGTTYQMVVINDGQNAGAWGGEDWGFNTITYYYPTVKIRPGAVIPSGTDGNLVIRDWAQDREIDMWVANIDETNRIITCVWGGVYPANGDGTSLAPNYAPPSQYAQSWPTAADRAAGRNMIYTCCASGLSCTAGLISLADIQSGSIDHALAFSTDITKGPPQGSNLAFFYPATSTDGQYTGNNYLEEGSRIQLQMSDAAIAAIPGVGNRMVARALKTYGAFCNDRGGSRMSFIAERPANATERAIYQNVGWNGSDWNSWNGVGIDWSTLRVLIPGNA